MVSHVEILISASSVVVVLSLRLPVLGSCQIEKTSSSAPAKKQSIATKTSVAPKGVIMRPFPPSLLTTTNNVLVGVRLYFQPFLPLPAFCISSLKYASSRFSFAYPIRLSCGHPCAGF
ncbi:hypothetical protein BLNAU_19628 [Blattamonas nauphoetae]|uniref:Secreted protein n=1 Tax=Blattamonas nauphoetae TaxID=2049346 RepID=A0ABQ9X0Z9_9EUKA|nr:hypothetical protein BLNAU_19628 [Blattamonas nauphoetae]